MRYAFAAFFVASILFPTSSTIAEAPAPVPIHIQKPAFPEILTKVAHCESGNRQFNDDGTVLRGRVNNQDVGEWQINEFYHLSQATKMGMDIYTEAGNREYALYLYKKNGLRDWSASEHCWSKL